MKSTGVTILIVAHNAQKTIARAIKSARASSGARILLIDDGSTDDTVSIAKSAGGTCLQVIHPRGRTTLGAARQTGLQALETPFAVLLDADDEILPGRIDRLVDALESDHGDIAADEIELADNITGRSTGHVRIPRFLLILPRPVRLFERNYLPGIGQIAFRTESMRRLGYDPAFHGAEDVDLVLRAVASQFTFSLVPVVGYRMWTSSQTLSRQRENQRKMYKLALLKHSYAQVRQLYEDVGLSRAISAWALASMAVFREEFSLALQFVEEAAANSPDPTCPLEPDGPCRRTESWRIAFFRGTLALKLGKFVEAVEWLQIAEKIDATPEGANNLGVALCHLRKDILAGRKRFIAALERMPHYTDARINYNSLSPTQITLHPFRQEPYRSDYPI